MENSIRRPKQGYVSDAKKEYRKNVWKELLDGIDASEITVACMPSKNGLELDVINSFDVDKIIAIDESPAVIASSAWRKKYPDVKCYGSKTSRASERIVEDGLNPEIANLDLCNNLSSELLEEVTTFVKNIKPKRIAITMMKGRESKALSYFIGKAAGEYPRAELLTQVIADIDSVYCAKIKHVGEYLNSKTPMMWVVFDIDYYKIGTDIDYLCADIKEMAGLIKKISDLEDKKIDLANKAYEIRENYREKLLLKNNKSQKAWLILNDNLRAQIKDMDDEYTAAEREILDIGGDLDDVATKFLKENHYEPCYDLTTVRLIVEVAQHFGFPPFRRTCNMRRHLTSLV